MRTFTFGVRVKSSEGKIIDNNPYQKIILLKTIISTEGALRLPMTYDNHPIQSHSTHKASL